MLRPLICTSVVFDHPLFINARSANIDAQIKLITMPFRKDRLKMASASQAACPLFQKLPSEVRNQIYEYAFTTDKSRHKALVTAAIKRPDNNFSLTCQRVFAEANGIYQVARTTYWKKSTFTSTG